MEKHLLVTVSEQPSALNGIRFVGRFFSSKEEIKLTLLYIAPRPPAVWEDERTHDRVTQIEQKARQYEAKGRKALEDAKRELVTLKSWTLFRRRKRDFTMQWYWAPGDCPDWKRHLMKAPVRNS
ncbi:MAG: hypothetical protein P8Y00_12285 [Deltaproteobacteria bacterium]